MLVVPTQLVRVERYLFEANVYIHIDCFSVAVERILVL